MSPRRTAQAAPQEVVRTFRLNVSPVTNDSYGVELTETYGTGNGPSTPVLSASAPQVSRVLDAVIASLKASGHTAGRLTTQRDAPIPLEEPAGVRLALTLFATQPVTKHDRIRALVAGVNAMSVEETYYWYAKCVGSDGSRARRALRLLLADDKATD